MREIEFRQPIFNKKGEFIRWHYFRVGEPLGDYAYANKHPKPIGQYTGYRMFNKKVFFGDLVSNNFKTNREVIREIVMHEGRIVMKRVKGKSSVPKYAQLHGWHQLNFRVIGNIHQDKHLIK